MLPSELIQLQLQYLQYENFCQRFGYTPTELDKENVARYLLLMSGSGSATLCESKEIQEKWLPLLEAHGAHHGADFNILDQLGSVSIPNIGLGKYVSYLFKRPTLSRLFKEEMMDEFEKLRQWKKLVELKKQLASAKDEKFTSKVDLPALHKSGGFSSSRPSNYEGPSQSPKRPTSKKPAH